MNLYHGSNIIIELIDLKKSNVAKDFGSGFYLSDNYEQAFHMGCFAVERENEGNVEVTTFEFDESSLNSSNLKILKFDGYTEEWANFIFLNRKNRSQINLHDYDIVIGPIADDKVGFQIRQFLYGYINIKQLVDALKYRKGITFQYFFATEKAIKYLRKL